MTDPVSDLFADLARIPDPLARLAHLAQARDHVDAFEARYIDERRRAILAARDQTDRPTWAEIGEIFGVSPQRAETMSKQQPSTTERTQP